MGPLAAGSFRQTGHQRFRVSHTADVGAVRRAVSGYADQLDAGPGLADRAGQAATELAANLLRHALPGGWILARPLPPSAVEIIAVDHGPCAGDATAEAGQPPRRAGLGYGLAAVARVSSYFDIDTCPGRPTTVLAVVASSGATRAAALPAPRAWAGISVGLDETCGDGWAVAEVSGGTTVAVVDGSGHGNYAFAAAAAALAALADDPADLDSYLARANAAMLGTRGAAIAVCRLEPGCGEMRCLSVGNVRGAILSDSGPHTLIHCRGTVGAHVVPPPARIACYPWPAGAMLVLWTDGLADHIELTAYARQSTHDPAITAAALYRDHSSDSDDSTVVVVKSQARP